MGLRSLTKLARKKPCVYLLNGESKTSFAMNNIQILYYSFFFGDYTIIKEHDFKIRKSDQGVD